MRRLQALADSHVSVRMTAEALERLRVAAERIVAIDTDCDDYCGEVAIRPCGDVRLMFYRRRSAAATSVAPPHRFEKRGDMWRCACGAVPWTAVENDDPCPRPIPQSWRFER